MTLTYSVAEAEGMGVIGGDTHRQCWDGRKGGVVKTERKGRKVGTGSVGTEGTGVMGGDTHRQYWDRKQSVIAWITDST